MATPKFKGVSTEKLNEALQQPGVRKALNARAQRILPTARAVALSVGAKAFSDALRVETGTRPGAKANEGLRRPYARVTAEVTPEMKRADGRTKLTRQQILRRGASNG